MSTLPDAISHLLDSTLVYVLGGLPNLLEFILRRLCASVFKRLLKRDQPGLHLTADQPSEKCKSSVSDSPFGWHARMSFVVLECAQGSTVTNWRAQAA